MCVLVKTTNLVNYFPLHEMNALGKCALFIQRFRGLHRTPGGAVILVGEGWLWARRRIWRRTRAGEGRPFIKVSITCSAGWATCRGTEIGGLGDRWESCFHGQLWHSSDIDRWEIVRVCCGGTGKAGDKRIRRQGCQGLMTTSWASTYLHPMISNFKLRRKTQHYFVLSV